MKGNFVFAVLGAFLLISCQNKETQNSQPKFQLSAKITGQTISFKGLGETIWTESSYSCKNLPCEFTLDEKGVNSGEKSPAVSMKVKLDGKNVELEGINGVKWQKLSYSCEGKECEFKIDENGVTGTSKP